MKKAGNSNSREAVKNLIEMNTAIIRFYTSQLIVFKSMTFSEVWVLMGGLSTYQDMDRVVM